MSDTSRVLLIEDNDASAGDYARWLTEAGHKVERAAARSAGIDKAEEFGPDVVVLDLQIPSAPGLADEHVDHGFATLDHLLQEDPFRPIVVLTAHSHDRELMRRVLQRTHGGQFVFKDARELERELIRIVDLALGNPAYQMSRAVRRFRQMLDEGRKEDEYRKFLHDNWRVFLGPEYRECHSPYEVTRGGSIDILAVRHDGFPDLWELKLPSDPVFKSYNQWRHHSLECAKAVGQLMEYLDLAEKEPIMPRGYDRRRGIDMQLHRPRGFVVIGRYQDDSDRDRLRLENRFAAGLMILTYDDLIERAEAFLTFLQQYRNGAGA